VTGEIDIDRLINLRGIDNLRLITSGTRISNPSEALDFVGMDRFLSEVRAAFDVVIIDCPPVLPVTDALTLSSKVDGVVLVYRVAKTKRDMLRRAKLQLENVGADICGVVLNDIKKEEQLGSSAYYFKYDYADVPSEKVGMLSQSLSKISSIFI
jgi:capsular exopolysaccharide synthesis family protein